MEDRPDSCLVLNSFVLLDDGTISARWRSFQDGEEIDSGYLTLDFKESMLKSGNKTVH